MKVKELIELLQKEDPEKLVVLASDEEGNYFQTLGYIESTYDFSMEFCQIGFSELTDDAIEDGYTEDDLLEDGVPCVVLWP